MSALRIHGGTGAHGPARFDFSTNSNACGLCPQLAAALQTVDAGRYPDHAYTRLRQRLAALHAVAPWRIVLAGSASEFIFRMTAWVSQKGGSRVWWPQQAYGDYGYAAGAWALQRVLDLEQACLVWACEPSSPLGQAHGEWPAALTSNTPGADVPLVLDCAYAPLRLSGAASLSAAHSDTVWRLYSPNKALGCTGIRGGYAIAPLQAGAAAGQLEAMAPSWPLGAHAEAMLLTWTQPETQAWLLQCRSRLAAWKHTQIAMLQSLGWHCLPSEAHFFCCKPPQWLDLAALLPALRAQGIQLRDASSLGLPGHVRVSVQPPHAQAALQAALRAAMDKVQTRETSL